MAVGYRPRLWWQVPFNADPNDIGAVPLWTDLTALVRKVGGWRRGRQYELAQSLTAESTITWRDVNEYLNPANTSSPYYPNVQPYRQLLGQAMWPNDGAGNLINTGRWRANNEVSSDPSFESYVNGAAAPNWLTAVGATVPTITTTNPQEGTKDLTYTVAATATRQGVSWIADCVPGQQYTSSAYIRQSTGSTQGLLVGDQTLAYDDFGRTASNGWGTADFGGAWSTANGAAGDYSVASGVGKHAINSLNVRRFTYMGTGIVDANVVMSISCPTLITGPSSSALVFAGLHARYIDVDNHYRAEIAFGTDGYIAGLGLFKRVAGVTTSMGIFSGALGFLSYTAGQQYKLRLEVTGNTVRVKLWPATAIEPIAWAISVVDTVLTAGGAVGAHTAADPSVTNGLPVTVNFDALMCTGSTSSTTTTTSGSYVRLTQSFTATQPRHTITVATTGTATAGTINLDAIQHEPGAAATAFTTTGPVIYPLMRPYVEDWPREWLSSGFEGMAVSALVDGFAALNSTTILPDYYYTLIGTKPTGIWPLKSGTSASALPDISGNDGINLSAIVSPFGAGSSPSYGASLPLVGDLGAGGVGFVPDQSVAIGAFAQQAATIVGAGRILNNTLGFNYPGVLSYATNNGLTISVWNSSVSCWFKTTTKNPSNYTYLAAMFDQASYRQILSIGLDASGLPFALTQGSGGNLTATGGATNYLDNRLHLMVATVEQVNGGSTTVEIYVDGVLVNSSNTTTAAMGGIYKRDADSVSIGGLADGLQMYAVANGTISYFTTWDRKLTSGEISTLYTAGTVGNANELTGTRLARQFAAAPYVGATRFSAGLTTLQPPSWPGAIDLLTNGQQITVAEDGTFWMGPDGAAVFEGRADRWARLSASYVLGENVAGGETPYLDGIRFSYDPMFVFANVQVTRNNGGTYQGGFPADIAAAVRKYFSRTYTENSDYATDTQAQNKADWVFNSHRAPGQRVSAITIDAAANPAAWPVALSLEVGKRITIKRRPKAANAGAGITMSADYFIETVIHGDIDMDRGTWPISFILSPIGNAAAGEPTVQPWILEDATYGVLDSTTVLGW